MATILIYPKVKCHVGCKYCFENPDHGAIGQYDKAKMMTTLQSIFDKRHDNVVIHGGEVLSLPIRDFKYFVKKTKEIAGSVSIQTSLMGLTSEHIRLFKEYQVNLGVSVDGPPDLNVLRGPRDPQKNKEYQAEIVSNMERLRKNKIGFGSITVLSKANASPDKIDRLVEWAKSNKINGRFNMMFAPIWQTDIFEYVLSPSEAKNAWIRLAEEVLKDKSLEWTPPREFIDNLLGSFSLSTCCVTRCDYLTTVCKTIMPDGSLARCDRCFQDGYYGRAPEKTFSRAEVLGQTECSACRYFEICGGGCPGEGVNGDFRHKSYFCEAYYGLYEFLEDRIRGMFPKVILSIDRENYYNDFHLAGKLAPWSENLIRSTWRATQPCKKCGDNKPQEQPDPLPSGRRPHGDWDNHGDSTPPMYRKDGEKK